MRTTFPEIAIHADVESDQSSSYDDDGEDDIGDEEVGKATAKARCDGFGNGIAAKKKGKPSITISLKKVCKVCKKPGHEAGFKGATYIDCPSKPCFLCKMPGHTTMTCPHKVATDHGVSPLIQRNSHSSLGYVFERQIRSNITRMKAAYIIPDRVRCAIVRYHSRRITCLEFHPTKNNILLSGDKKGQVGIWDFDKVHEKIVYGHIHTCIVNNIKFSQTNDGTIYAASSDGTISYSDIETGISSSVMNLNPDGWQGPNSWRMLYGMDINFDKNVVLVADNFGFLFWVDGRSKSRVGNEILIHKKGSKVVGLHCNPVQQELLLSCGNDHFARLWDIRRLEAGSSLYNLEHRRVVNAAYFSPLSGTKILTTSQDNRLRVWDSIFGDLGSPSREIIHSHDFNRHLTPFKAEWDPKDPTETLAVIGRYISENFHGAALHPIDFIDCSTGQLVAEVMDPNITTISPVNKTHPRADLLASGSSRSIFIWSPREDGEETEQRETNIVICADVNEKSKKKTGGKNHVKFEMDKV